MGKRCIGDLESNGLLDEATVIWCGVFKDIDTGEVTKFRPHQMVDMMSFLNTVDTLIMHNGIAFDKPLMKKLLNFEFKGKLIDTLVMSRVLNPNRSVPFNCPYKKAPHSVEAWGYRVGRGKPEHNDWAVFSEAMLHRCSEDVEIQHLIYDELMREAESTGGWFDAPYRPMDMTHKLFEILHEQEQHGWLLDVDHAKRCIDHLTHIVDTIAVRIQPRLPLRTVAAESSIGLACQDEIEKYCEPLRRYWPDFLVDSSSGVRKYVRAPFLKNGSYNQHVKNFLASSGHIGRIVGPHSRISIRPLNLESADEMKDLLLSLGWEPAVWNTNDAGERTSPKLSKDDPFDGIQGGIGKMIAKRIQCKHRRSNIEGYLENVRTDGRVSGRVTGLATTGRAKHAVIVNVPGPETFYGKKMRACFTAPKGKVIVGTDSAGCQNRMLAARVNDDFFTKTLLEGKKSDKTSIHHVNQKAILAETGLDVSYHDSKTTNYAVLFGASDRKICQTLASYSCSPEQAAGVKRAIFGVAPGFQNLVDSLKEEWRSNAKIRMGKYGRPEYYNGWVRGLDGRPIFIESEHAILVYMLQSDEAIMMAGAFCKLYLEATKRWGRFGGKWASLIWYHDEFQCEVDEDIAEEFAHLAEDCIVWSGKFYNIACPHQGDSDIGRNWAETH